MSLRIEDAYSFYRGCILAGFRARKPFYEERNIRRLDGAVPAQDWEVFGAILVDDVGNDKSYGSDLVNHEVKSIKRVNNSPQFEYQYHKKAWREKLEHDKTIDHVFILYENGYEDLEVHMLEPEPFVRHVESKDWSGKLQAKYEEDRDRGRCAIPFTLARSKGRTVMKIKDGELAPLPEQVFPLS